MRLLMTPAVVTLADGGSPATVAWRHPGSHGRGRSAGSRPRRVLCVIDRWRYDGRWWEAEELHRDYLFIELEGGVRAEVFKQGDDWWVARVSD